ncbi:MAG: hypothetical protein KTR24_00770 [Saprospiraceae bacterium]|nr:hypothetical protein [Saprospiraceae bacterium]
MKHFTKVILTLSALLLLSHQAEAQLLDRVLRKTKQKVGQKVEDMVVEKASEYIAQRVYKSMSDGFDKMLADAYKQDSTYQANYSDSVAIKYGGLARDWMSRMNEAADVPDAYAFDATVTAITTYKRDKDNMVLYFSNENGVFAMEQEERGTKRIFLLDTEKDVTILYEIDGKKKTAQAIPNMMALTGSMISSSMQEQEDVEWTLEEIKGKKVAGYNCKGFKGSSDIAVTQTYLSEEVDISWSKSFLDNMKKFIVALNTDDEKYAFEGMVMESTYQEVEKPKEKHFWQVTDIDNSPFKIVNAEFDFGGMTASE